MLRWHKLKHELFRIVAFSWSTLTCWTLKLIHYVHGWIKRIIFHTVSTIPTHPAYELASDACDSKSTSVAERQKPGYRVWSSSGARGQRYRLLCGGICWSPILVIQIQILTPIVDERQIQSQQENRPCPSQRQGPWIVMWNAINCFLRLTYLLASW